MRFLLGYSAKLDAVKTYMRMRRVPEHLKIKVIKWFDYLWMTQKSSDEDKSVGFLPGKCWTYKTHKKSTGKPTLTEWEDTWSCLNSLVSHFFKMNGSGSKEWLSFIGKYSSFMDSISMQMGFNLALHTDLHKINIILSFAFLSLSNSIRHSLILNGDGSKSWHELNGVPDNARFNIRHLSS